MLGVCQNLWVFVCPPASWGLTSSSQWDLGLGSFLAMDPKFRCFVPPSHLVITFALWQGAPSCWKRHCSSPNCSMMVGRSCSWRMFWYHSLFMAVFWGKIVSEPTPLAEKQPTHEWSQDPLLLAWHRTDGSAHLFFSEQAFFRMPQTIGMEIHQRKLLYPSPQQSYPCTFCRRSVCRWCFFPGEMWLLCCPSWHKAILQKSSPHCVCRCTHTCLLPFLSKLCTGGAPIPQLNQL